MERVSNGYRFDFVPNGNELRLVDKEGSLQFRVKKDGSLIARDTDLHREDKAFGCSGASRPPDARGVAYDCAGGLATAYTIADCVQYSGSANESDLAYLFTIGSKNGTPESPNGGLLLPAGSSSSDSKKPYQSSMSVDVANRRAYFIVNPGGQSPYELAYADLETGQATQVGALGSGRTTVNLAVDNGSTVCR